MIFIGIYVVFIITVLLFVYTWCTKELEKYKDIDKLPGPSVIELIYGLIKNRSHYDRYIYFTTFNERYGSTFKIWLKPFSPIIMTTDHEYFEKILMSNKHFAKGPFYNAVKSYAGNGIGTNLDAESWKKDRKMCNTVFQHSNIISFLPVFAQHNLKLLEILKKYNGQAVNIEPLIHPYTLDVIFETFLKRKQNFQENESNTYLIARETYFATLRDRFYSILLLNNLLFRLFGNFQAQEQSVHIMKKLTQEVIQNEKEIRTRGKIKKYKTQLLDILFENFDQNEIIGNHVDTFLMAGHHTTAQTICFTLYELSQHQNIQQKVYEEMTTILGNDKGAEMTNEHIQNMKYLECVLKEVLRFRTLICMVQRNLTEDIVINGINHPKNTPIVFNLKGIHDSERYFTNPDKFDPDRFAPENEPLILKGSYAPFSLGPRDCIGKQYGLLLVKFSVAKILQKFTLLPVKDHEAKLFYEMITVSLTGLPVIFQERA